MSQFLPHHLQSTVMRSNSTGLQNQMCIGCRPVIDTPLWTDAHGTVNPFNHASYPSQNRQKHVHGDGGSGSRPFLTTWAFGRIEWTRLRSANSTYSKGRERVASLRKVEALWTLQGSSLRMGCHRHFVRLTVESCASLVGDKPGRRGC